MIRLKDQLNRIVELDAPAKRIISLVPSQTELLYDLSLEDEVIGITKFCIHPDEWFRNKTRIGGTKSVDIAKIEALDPDLIIANKEENTPEDIEVLAGICPVYISDVITIQDALDMIKDVGKLCGREQKAVDLLDSIQEEFSQFPQYSGSVLYFIWRDPYMVCGTNNFIHSIIEKLGFENIIRDERYITLPKEQIPALDVDYVFLSTEPFPFKEEHIAELEKLTTAKIKIVDGEMFSWYGSRMLKMRKYFEKLL